MSDAKIWMQNNARNLSLGKGALPHWRFPDRSVVCWDDYLTTFWPAKDDTEADREIRRRARARARWRTVSGAWQSTFRPLLLTPIIVLLIWALDVAGMLP